MPGPQVKNWAIYHALRLHGHSKQSAAMIANAASQPKRASGRRATRKHKKRGGR